MKTTAGLGRTTIGGVDVEVRANSGGRFMIVEGDTTLGADETLEGAKAKARTIIAKRKVRVEVEFRRKNGERGTATGIHAGTRRVTATMRTGLASRAEQINGREDVFKADTSDEVLNQIKALERESRDVARRAKALEEKHLLNGRRGLGDAVRDAITAEVERRAENGEGA